MAYDFENFDSNNIEKITEAAADKAAAVVDSAPKKRRGRPPGSRNKTGLLPVSELKDGLEQFMTLIGVGMTLYDPYDGSVIIKQASPMADAVANVAAKDKKIHATLTKAMRAGSWAAVATAGIPIVMAIGANHGFLPANSLTLMDTGVEPTIVTRAYQENDTMSTSGDEGADIGSLFDRLNNVSESV